MIENSLYLVMAMDTGVKYLVEAYSPEKAKENLATSRFTAAYGKCEFNVLIKIDNLENYHVISKVELNKYGVMLVG